VLNNAVKIVNEIQSRPLNFRVFRIYFGWNVDE